MQRSARLLKSRFQEWQSYILDRTYKNWRDIAIALILALIGGLASYSGSRLIDPAFFNREVIDVWFQSDLPRIFSNMTSRGSNHYRTKVHPLFSLIGATPVFVLEKALKIEQIVAVRITIAIVAALWITTLYIVLRAIGCRRLDATLFAILGATSAAAVFWFTVPETYSFGSLTILLGLGFVALTQYRQFSWFWYLAVSATTLSMTVTNWMVGILATAVNRSWQQTLKITGGALIVTFGLSVIQSLIFPSARLPFLGKDAIKEEFYFLMRPDSGGPLKVFKSFVFHTMVMPAINITDLAGRVIYPRMETQFSSPGSGSLWSILAVGLWAALLGLGLWSLFSLKKHPKFRLVLGLTILGQLGLHILYGNETFLYALHFIPLLILLAALTTLTRARLLGLLLAVLLLFAAGIENGLQFHQVTRYFLDQAPIRHLVRVQMKQRPDDPWMRGMGHVVLAMPGSREEDKSYYEPGGSFSPAVGSFGVSIWMVDRQGKPIATSDDIPLEQIQQQLIYTDGQKLPEIITKTDYYQALWSSAGAKRWQLNLKTPANLLLKPAIAIRSVGPAGGAVRSLDWNGQRLQINDRWSVKLDRAPAGTYLGKEGPSGWLNERSNIARWQGDDGWGYARFELGDGNEWNLTIEDSAPVTKTDLTFSQTESNLVLNLPDERFAKSLDAQVAHMMMGLVGRQTRPGEPTNYPSAWMRDGAYVLVALARSGRLEVAKQLATDFAREDFFGGFGPEADDPGLAIWALEEVAKLVNDPEYDRWLWTHVRRKAEFILAMLAAKQPIHQPIDYPIVPQVSYREDLTLVAEPAKDGLIVGRMDHHRPILFVNAVSYRGLRDAASLADRVNQPADANRWRAKAAELQKAWEKAFVPPESDNDRTYISSLWQTWIGTSLENVFRQELQARWTKKHDERGSFLKAPPWTYFEIAEAHQWLYLGKPDRMWATLEWFWQNQASPGLYTWWEGRGEENSSYRWFKVRGWVNPPHVTPHYWTAAEMLLLQLDMLAYLDRPDEEPTLVVGAGIPQKWLTRSMEVEGLSIPGGRVNWNWDGKRMAVQIRGNKMKVKLGTSFPANTPIQVEYLS